MTAPPASRDNPHRVAFRLLTVTLFLMGLQAAWAAEPPLKFNQSPSIILPPNNAALIQESAFIRVAKVVSPAVVNISSEWTEHLQGFQGPGDMNDFFNWFYGQNMRPQQIQRKQRSLGSGFLITPDGYILTNSHVVSKAEKLTVLLENGKTYAGRVVGNDPKTDIALVKIEAGNGLPNVPLGDSDAIQVGQSVMAIGNPFGLDHTVTSGVVSAKGRTVNLNENSPYSSYIQTDASINPGNSGGPLCNLRGEVIGINTAIYSQSGNNIGIGFAIPANVAKKVAQDLASQGKVVRAGFGAVVQSLDSRMAASFGLDSTAGALLSSINAGEAADKAGLKPGDIVLTFDGEPVDSASDLVAKLYTKAPGDQAQVEVLREGKEITTTITLQALSDDSEPTHVTKRAPMAPVDTRTDPGFLYQDQTPEIRVQLPPSAPRGPVVLQVGQESPAAAAGLRPGDVVLKVGDRDVPTAKSLQQALNDGDLKKGIRLFIWRDGSTLYGILQTGE